MNCRPQLIVGAIALLIFGAGSMAAAQLHYDSTTVTKTMGSVVAIEETGRQAPGLEVRLILQSPDQKLPVYLAPKWYLRKHTPNVAVNDFIIVTGSRVPLDGRPAIIAAQIQKGVKVLRLRNAQGDPLWATGRGGR